MPAENSISATRRSSATASAAPPCSLRRIASPKRAWLQRVTARTNTSSESRKWLYIAAVVNNRKEVIQCLIVYRRGRRHS